MQYLERFPTTLRFRRFLDPGLHDPRLSYTDCLVQHCAKFQEKAQKAGDKKMESVFLAPMNLIPDCDEKKQRLRDLSYAVGLELERSELINNRSIIAESDPTRLEDIGDTLDLVTVSIFTVECGR